MAFIPLLARDDRLPSGEKIVPSVSGSFFFRRAGDLPRAGDLGSGVAVVFLGAGVAFFLPLPFAGAALKKLGTNTSRAMMTPIAANQLHVSLQASRNCAMWRTGN